MKKTLIITLEFPPQIGGIATYTEAQANNLDNSEQVIVYAPKNLFAKNYDHNKVFKIIRKKPLFTFFWPRWLKMFWQIFFICRREKVEIIFIHQVLPVGYVAWLVKKFLHIPFIVFSHGTDIIYASKSAWKIRMLKKIIGSAEQAIFNSESLRNRALRIMPEFEKRFMVLYPCPNTVFFDIPNKDDIKLLKNRLALDGKKIALSVSRFDEGKGLTHMVRLLPQILRKVPNFVWVVIGDGPKKKQLFAEVQKQSLQNAVRFIGQIDHDELNIYYHTADLFVLLTHPDEGREEGLGLVFLEASAAGLPIVAGRSGGVEEAVIHTETGLVVDIYQDLTVVSAIEKLILDRDYGLTLGSNAKERVKSDFQWSHQLSKLDPWLSKLDSIDLKF